MNAHHILSRHARNFVRAAFLVTLTVVCGCNKPHPPPGGAKPAAAVAKPAAPAAAATTNNAEYVSVFDDLPPQLGKDPFYPMSHRRDPAAPATPTAAPEHIDTTVVLKGIVGSPGRRIAVINNETMQQGEESLVRTPGGHVKVKCLEIDADSVLVQIEGEPQPKKLVMEQKK